MKKKEIVKACTIATAMVLSTGFIGVDASSVKAEETSPSVGTITASPEEGAATTEATEATEANDAYPEENIAPTAVDNNISELTGGVNLSGGFSMGGNITADSKVALSNGPVVSKEEVLNVTAKLTNTTKLPYGKSEEEVAKIIDGMKNDDLALLPVTITILPKNDKGEIIEGAKAITFTSPRVVRKLADDKFQIELYSPINGMGMNPKPGDELNPDNLSSVLFPEYNLNTIGKTFWLNNDNKVAYVGFTYGMTEDEINNLKPVNYDGLDSAGKKKEMNDKGIIVSSTNERPVSYKAGKEINMKGLTFTGNYTSEMMKNITMPKFEVKFNAKEFEDKSELKLKDENIKIKAGDKLLELLKANVESAKGITGEEATYTEAFLATPNAMYNGDDTNPEDNGKYTISILDGDNKVVAADAIEPGKEYKVVYTLRRASWNNPADIFSYNLVSNLNVEVEKPVEPEIKPETKPETPENNSNINLGENNKEVSTHKVAKTGDNTNVGYYAFLILGSISMAAFAVKKRR